VSTTLDLIGSFVVGGLLLLIMFTARSNLVESSYERNMDLIAQEHVGTLVEMLQHDFRKMGFGVPDSVVAVQAADSTSVSFLGDLDADGSVDTVSYSVSDTSAASGTENPRDRLFLHQINGQPTDGVNMGVTTFHLTYLDSSGSATAVPAQIRSVGVSLTVESLYPYDDWYAKAMWEGVIRPRNLDLN
jgi:hypothetical protein